MQEEKNQSTSGT